MLWFSLALLGSRGFYSWHSCIFLHLGPFLPVLLHLILLPNIPYFSKLKLTLFFTSSLNCHLNVISLSSWLRVFQPCIEDFYLHVHILALWLVLHPWGKRQLLSQLYAQQNVKWRSRCPLLPLTAPHSLTKSYPHLLLKSSHTTHSYFHGLCLV